MRLSVSGPIETESVGLSRTWVSSIRTADALHRRVAGGEATEISSGTPS